jgi:regulator of sigma E protease
MLLTIVATLIVLGGLIFIHELGHFLAARAAGVDVERFSVGFGPRLFGVRVGPTDYRISLLPFGGYVKLRGLESPTSRKATSEETPEGATPAGEARARDRGDYRSRSVGTRAFIVGAGVAMNALFAVLALALVAGTRGIHVPEIGFVAPRSPASATGLQKGDVVTRFDGRRIGTFSDVERMALHLPDRTVGISVRRGDRTIDTEITPLGVRRPSPLAGDSIVVGALGIEAAAPEVTHRSLGVAGALREGARQSAYWVRAIGAFVARVGSGRDSVRKLGGPVAIGEMSGRFARAGWLPFLEFAAVISLNLAVLNLLPVPVLDGGHLALLAVEGARGRPVEAPTRRRLTRVGLVLVFGLMALAMWNDAVRLFG